MRRSARGGLSVRPTARDAQNRLIRATGRRRGNRSTRANGANAPRSIAIASRRSNASRRRWAIAIRSRRSEPTAAREVTRRRGVRRSIATTTAQRTSRRSDIGSTIATSGGRTTRRSRTAVATTHFASRATQGVRLIVHAGGIQVFGGSHDVFDLGIQTGIIATATTQRAGRRSILRRIARGTATDFSAVSLSRRSIATNACRALAHLAPHQGQTVIQPLHGGRILVRTDAGQAFLRAGNPRLQSIPRFGMTVLQGQVAALARLSGFRFDLAHGAADGSQLVAGFVHRGLIAGGQQFRNMRFQRLHAGLQLLGVR